MDRESQKPQDADSTNPQSIRSVNAALSARVPQELASLPQYTQVEPLGEGGMGVVYKAHHSLMNRPMVLKVVNRQLLSNVAARERFLREIRAAARLQHINIVTAYDAFYAGDSLVFAMEYVAGQDLQKLVKSRGALKVHEATYFVYQVALGLQHAHEAGMIHRDIKPQNLMVVPQGQKRIVKILDFGLAKATQETANDSDLTGTGAAMGTPDYMPPEQTADASRADIRADIYALGCTLFYLLMGKPPFQATNLFQLMYQHRESQPPRLDELRTDVPPDLAEIVAKMLAKKPADRFQTPQEVARALTPFFRAPAKRSGEQPMGLDIATELEETELPDTVLPAPVATPFPQSAIDEPVHETNLEQAQSHEYSSEIRADRKKRRMIPLLALIAVPVMAFAGIIAYMIFGDGVGMGTGQITSAGTNSDLNLKTKVAIADSAEKGELSDIKPIVSPKTINDFLDISETNSIKPIIVPKIDTDSRIDKKPTNKIIEEYVEEFEWRDEKRKRTITKVHLGGEFVEFVTVPAGSFLMGSPNSDKDAYRDEKPQHRVTFTKANRVGKYTITKGQFAAFVKATNYLTDAETDSKGGWGYTGTYFRQSKNFNWKNTGWIQTDRHPVVNISHNDAVAFCKWASKLANRTIRLLTEAEYEYANRAGSTTRYFTGDAAESLAGYANIADRSFLAKYPKASILGVDDGEPFTSRVGKYKANRFGLHDMTGNVWSWCADWYDRNLYERGAVSDPKAIESKQRIYRVLRGGSWYCDASVCRGADRFKYEPSNRFDSFGFRVCLPLD